MFESEIHALSPLIFHRPSSVIWMACLSRAICGPIRSLPPAEFFSPSKNLRSWQIPSYSTVAVPTDRPVTRPRPAGPLRQRWACPSAPPRPQTTLPHHSSLLMIMNRGRTDGRRRKKGESEEQRGQRGILMLLLRKRPSSVSVADDAKQARSRERLKRITNLAWQISLLLHVLLFQLRKAK